MHITFTTRFAGKSKDSATLYCRIRMDSVIREIMLPLKVDEKWKSTYKVLKYIDSVKKDLNDIHLRLITKGIEPTPDLVKNEYARSKETVMFVKLMDEFIAKKITPRLAKGDISQTTVDKFAYTRNHVIDFLEINKRCSDINISSVSTDVISDLNVYLEKFSKNNTAVKHLQRVKRVLDYAVNIKECIDKNPFNGYAMKQTPTTTTYLTQEELIRIIEKNLGPRLSRIRELFLFQCFTGLSYIDMKNLSRKHIDLTNNLINMTRQKTKGNSIIHIYPFADLLLRKYDYKLPVKSNQKMNEYLKELETICHIDKTLTTHVARHTFATTVSLQNGVPLEIVSKMLGHSSVVMTEHYAKLSPAAIMLSGENNDKNMLKYSEAVIDFVI